ncbi:palmitoyltransferase ZDHHC1-like [Gigantopelta aegis]|uniref:palmitoyltransferase ZDHHC1-like n=1 Tax=Gigantopelta aegis TaxID=1735272 RepID=UPI001B887560|nr:palmitoyltransferase ZDHHC1-like [Gigantopelta aegis]
MAAIQPEETGTEYVSCQRNGWTIPPDLYQLIAWAGEIFFILINYGMIIPSLPEELQAVCYVVNGLATVAHILCVLITTTINTAHEAVLQKPVQRTLAVFDREKYDHVIEDQYCHLCEINVDEKTKHCRACNKCIAHFDHHCEWLNNCIGRRNYRWFIMTLITGVISFSLILCTSLAQFIAYFTDRMSGRILQPYQGNGSNNAVFFIFCQPIPNWLWMTLQSMIIFLGITSVCLMTALLGLHCYTGYKKISTFRLIIQNRKTKEEGSQQERCLLSRKTWANIFKVNRVDPLKEIIPDVENGLFSSINDGESHGLQGSTSSHQASSQSVAIHSAEANTNIGPQHLEPIA